MNAIISVAEIPIRQLNGLYSLNDLHRAAGGEDRHSPRRWLQNQQTVDLTLEVEKDGNPSILKSKDLELLLAKSPLYTTECGFEERINSSYCNNPITKHLPIREVFFVRALPRPRTLGR